MREDRQAGHPTAGRGSVTGIYLPDWCTRNLFTGRLARKVRKRRELIPQSARPVGPG